MPLSRVPLAFVLACFASGSDAHAGPGLRAGVTSDPDSLFAGLQWRVLMNQGGPGRLALQPGGDLAIVDGPVDFLVRGTLHLGYLIPISDTLSMYPLLGPSLIWALGDLRAAAQDRRLES